MKRLVDVLWLTLLVGLVFAIPPTFHGDEAMLLGASRDYATVFIDGNPNALLVYPPYTLDSDAQLRLLNGSVHRYLSGFLWHLGGAGIDELPARPGWNWQLDFDGNVASEHLPSDSVLAAGRLASALCLALSVVAMFALAWQFGGRLPAYATSALYTLNPIILLNGRRAMQEGALLLFGLLVLLVAVRISKRRAENNPPRFYLWLALGVAAALAVASKHNAVVFVGAAFGWVAVAEVLRRPLQPLMTAMKLGLAGLLALALFIALSPALWSDPSGRLSDLLQQRTMLLEAQVIANRPLAPTTIPQRLEAVITEPFMTPLQHFEVAGWATYPQITADVDRYMASPFSGVQFGVVLGGIVTLLALVGVLFSLRRGWQAGVLVWLGLTVASLLVNPLPWQRYSLPLIPVYALLAGIGVAGLARRFGWKAASIPVPDSTPERPVSPAG